MAKRKKVKRINSYIQNTTQKLNTNPTKKIGPELRCSGWVDSSYSTSGNRGATLVTNPVISHESVLTTSGTYPWSCVTHIFVTVNQVMVAIVKLSK